MTGADCREGGGLVVRALGWFVQVKGLQWYRASRWSDKERRWVRQGWRLRVAAPQAWTWRYNVAEGRCCWAWGPLRVKLPVVSNADGVALPFGERQAVFPMAVVAEGVAAPMLPDLGPRVATLTREQAPPITADELRQAVELALAELDGAA